MIQIQLKRRESVIQLWTIMLLQQFHDPEPLCRVLPRLDLEEEESQYVRLILRDVLYQDICVHIRHLNEEIFRAY